MSDMPFLLADPATPGVVVRSATVDDIELLREWKNQFRNSFFFKEIITPAMQSEWFAAYRRREDDYMGVVVANGERVGCIGYRCKDGVIDVYNVILAGADNRGQGIMTTALDLMCADARQRYPGLRIQVSVLKDNPALAWYYRRGFTLHREHAEHVELVRHAPTPEQVKE